MHRKPNFLMLVADQHRADCLGCAGQFPVKTPHLDRLAERGVRFENAFTPLPVCAPARQAMLCGENPDSYGAFWNFGFFAAASLSPKGYWPEALANSGYQTAFFGKWSASEDFGPTDFGYQTFVSMQDYEAFCREKYPNRKRPNWFGDTSELPLEHSKTHFLAGNAARFIEEFAKSDAPWHIRVDYTDPHLPCEPSEPFASMYNPADIPPWPGVGDTFEGKPYIQKQQLYSWGIEDMTWADWQPAVARYYAMVSQIDDSIGLMLAALERTGQLENTVILYTADHGDMCGSHGMLDKHYVLFDDVVRVPMIWAGPNIVPGRLENKFVSCGLDLPATINDLLGISAPQGQGASMAPLLAGQDVPWRTEITASSNGQQFGFFNQRMIRDQRYKYIWNLTDVDEFYDLLHDPGEKQNLIYAPEHKERVASMRRKLLATLREQKDLLVRSGWLDRQLAENKKI